MTLYEKQETTTPSRHPERVCYDEAVVHAVLDEALLAHVGFVVKERPQVLPLLFVRVGQTVYLHSSTGARPARMAARQGGIELCIEVTLVDALVLARSAFNHSANYRSVVAHGRAALVDSATEKDAVLVALMDKLVPGRSADARLPDETELRQTAVLALPLDEVGAKIRTGDPSDDEEDMGLSVWAGLRPIVTSWGAAQPSADLSPGIALPGYLAPAGPGPGRSGAGRSGGMLAGPGAFSA
jgi:nitroimidazol reductase NimA-like FMN-containing flavoprotein (pyridoxamine 5'-phosphate oxidase superfamily)